ncbi:hypothetical protein FOPG_18578 [Fusarium oxysporum f. sp. conglutinans race 2 54008]|uniref:Uncharacterized protein n=1 Tax=Fusarium oxysporum f. sp. conglutinans race 2 54008 TaxID=1089457 RepID=X0GPF1_FUSOX|nr:hypothetical protein FOPG_18578 [Fusarium oxysporum f. sp. conglutinans race 2 54008]
MKAEFQLEFTKFKDRMAKEVTRATAQTAQELSQVRDQLIQACGELEQTRLLLDMLGKTETPRSLVQTYANAARMTPTSMSSQSSSAARSATPEPAFCTVDTSREAPGARVLRDQSYPIKVDSMNRTTVFDQEFNVLPGVMETLSHENGDQIAKVAWLSRKVDPKTYGSMVVYLTKNNDAKRLLQTFSSQVNRHIRVNSSRSLDRNNAITAKGLVTDHSCAARIESLLSLISSEIALRNNERDTVENAVQKLVQAAYENMPVRKRLGLGGTVTF